MGQLNVNADSQAEAYNLEFGEHRPFVLMSPKTRAHLQFPDGTVTGHYPQILQYEASTKPLLEYIQHKNEWTTSVLHSIHWEAHARAIKRSAIPHTHLVKMLHALLPTHARANKFDGGSRLCVLCGSNPTTTSYAANITLVTLGDKHFFRDLRDFFISSNISPLLLSNLLLNSIRQWFLLLTDVLIQPECYHPLLRPTIHQQNAIGGQLFMGRFAISWSRTQSQYFEHYRSVDNIKKHGTAWQASLI